LRLPESRAGRSYVERADDVSRTARGLVEYYGSEKRAPVARSAGDLNGDGHDDILVFQLDDRIGETYRMILGSSDIAALDLSALTAFGSDALFQLVCDTTAPGEHWQAQFDDVIEYAYFATVVGARDFNGDGFDDTAAGVARAIAAADYQILSPGAIRSMEPVTRWRGPK
jgi:hypothetical protein